MCLGRRGGLSGRRNRTYELHLMYTDSPVSLHLILVSKDYNWKFVYLLGLLQFCYFLKQSFGMLIALFTCYTVHYDHSIRPSKISFEILRVLKKKIIKKYVQVSGDGEWGKESGVADLGSWVNKRSRQNMRCIFIIHCQFHHIFEDQ